MKKIPSKLKIGGITYEVKLISGLADCGSTKFDNSTILINKDQTEERQATTLLHEIIEVISEHNDLNLSHQTIQTFESNLFQVLVDNFIK